MLKRWDLEALWLTVRIGIKHGMLKQIILVISVDEALSLRDENTLKSGDLCTAVLTNHVKSDWGENRTLERQIGGKLGFADVFGDCQGLVLKVKRKGMCTT